MFQYNEAFEFVGARMPRTCTDPRRHARNSHIWFRRRDDGLLVAMGHSTSFNRDLSPWEYGAGDPRAQASTPHDRNASRVLLDYWNEGGRDILVLEGIFTNARGERARTENEGTRFSHWNGAYLRGKLMAVSPDAYEYHAIAARVGQLRRGSLHVEEALAA